MNVYTSKEQFTEDAEFILENCELLVKSCCVIYEGVLYELLGIDSPNEHNYRFFFNCDDYDYLEDGLLESILDDLLGGE